jgi:hypothetical protein
MGNITQNKPATANNSVAPFLPARAVDGISSPANRWVSQQVPAWLAVDLQNSFWVNQWTANLMGNFGWAPGYNIKNFKLQGSNDNVNWFDMDNISNNSANQINRMITPAIVRYLRVYISNGLTVNNGVASIVDFQAFEPDSAPFLLNLVSSAGPFVPAFSSRIFNYSINVPSSMSAITFTPPALQSNMAIKVNGSVVVSGQASQAISLYPGNTTVSIEVTSVDGTMKTTYSVVVSKANDSAAYLSGLGIKTNRSAIVSYSPQLTDGTLNYSASVASGVPSVILTPTAANSTILVNGTAVASGSDSYAITLMSGINNITIKVTNTSGGIGNYTITITKA